MSMGVLRAASPAASSPQNGGRPPAALSRSQSHRYGRDPALSRSRPPVSSPRSPYNSRCPWARGCTRPRCRRRRQRCSRRWACGHLMQPAGLEGLVGVPGTRGLVHDPVAARRDEAAGFAFVQRHGSQRDKLKKSPAGEVQIGVLDPRLLVQVRPVADEYVRIVVVVKVARGGHRRGRRVDVSNDLLSLILVMWTLTFACKSVNSIE